MKKVQCKEGLDIYKKFLTRMTRISEFLKVAEVSQDLRPASPGFLSDSSVCSMCVQPVLDPFMRQLSPCLSLLAETAVSCVVHTDTDKTEKCTELHTVITR